MVAEYTLRLLAAPAGRSAASDAAWTARRHYASSPAGLVDLAAVAPIGVALVLGAPAAVANLFGALWVLKLARYSSNLAVLGRVLRDARRSLLSVLLLFGTVLLLAATAAHVVEGERQPEDFGSIGSSLWWAVTTLTTTGYGDDVPLSTVGRLLAGAVMISGIAIFALWAGILANGFSQEIRRRDFLETWELVARVPFFRNVGAAAIAEVARLLHPREYGAGATIFWRGQSGDCMYFIVSGGVALNVDGRKVEYGPGEFFGEVALVAGGRRTGTAVANQASTLLTLDIADFHELASRQPDLSRAIHTKAASRLDRSQTRRDGNPE
jgi:voltage-gated potassium channel